MPSALGVRCRVLVRWPGALQVLQPGEPRIAALDSFEALRAWADVAIERRQETGCTPC
ncbi:hypothetical protein [Nonomuraea sp. NPDC049504]|uniref:hypothetical protein n=1 Tax=Nonomuraea sp. NPDC049504 TaxID=3154729 RepID=UPI00341F5273